MPIFVNSSKITKLIPFRSLPVTLSFSCSRCPLREHRRRRIPRHRPSPNLKKPRYEVQVFASHFTGLSRTNFPTLNRNLPVEYHTIYFVKFLLFFFIR